ncbi:MAG: DUF3108 domain-containing protein, partial [Gemmatimonadaceae bacterium]
PRRAQPDDVIRPVVATLLGLALGAADANPVEGQVTRAPVPFEVGESLTYDVRFGALKIGTGRMRVLGMDTVRGRAAWHVRFSVTGGTFFYRVNDVYQSWMDVRTLNSLRFVQDLSQGSRERERTYEFFPERSTYRELERSDGTERPSVPDPLDDGSFLFFVRTLPLEVGETYSFDRYFKPDRNPVVIRVLRRERIRVPAGEFAAIVIQPIIKTPGIFSEGGQAEIWLSDDDKRMMLQMKSRLSFGSLNLYLRSFRLSAAVPEVEVTPDPPASP